MSNVTEIKRATPPLTDIAGHLESLAKLLRNGDTVLQSVLLVCERPDGTVYCAGFGQVGSGHEAVGKLEAAKDEVKASMPRQPEPEAA